MDIKLATKEQLEEVFHVIKKDLRQVLSQEYPDFHFEREEFLTWVKTLANSHYELIMAYVDDYGFLSMRYKLNRSDGSNTDKENSLPEQFVLCLPSACQCGTEVYDPEEWILASTCDEELLKWWQHKSTGYWTFRQDDDDDMFYVKKFDS